MKKIILSVVLTLLASSSVMANSLSNNVSTEFGYINRSEEVDGFAGGSNEINLKMEFFEDFYTEVSYKVAISGENEHLKNTQKYLEIGAVIYKSEEATLLLGASYGDEKGYGSTTEERNGKYNMYSGRVSVIVPVLSEGFFFTGSYKYTNYEKTKSSQNESDHNENYLSAGMKFSPEGSGIRLEGGMELIDVKAVPYIRFGMIY